MLPILELVSNNVNWQVGELRNHLAAVLDLSDEEIHERYEGGGKSVLATRVQFALMDLCHAELVVRPTRGNVRITEQGLEYLSKGFSEISRTILYEIPAYQSWRERDEVDTDDEEALDAEVTAVRNVDVERVRDYVTRHYPAPEVRRMCLQRLAQSIQIAHLAAATSWKTAFSSSGIALFVGPVWTVIFQNSRLDLVLLKKSYRLQCLGPAIVSAWGWH